MAEKGLRELGEFGLIARVAAGFDAPSGEGERGIGDDCAVLDAGGGRVTLMTTDMLVEGVHFLRDRISSRALGAKAMVVNLSDIAAMGGAPRVALLSLGLPEDVELAWVEAFFVGVGEACAASGTLLVGGDTTRSPGTVVINVAVVGEMRAECVAYRSAGREGDVVFTTGCLGDSGGGLRLLFEGEEGKDADVRALLEAHRSPRAHLDEGAWLVEQEGMGAMMDVSDGVGSDLVHLVRASGVRGAVVELDRVPVSDVLGRVAARRGWSVEELAVSAGEDYVLLGTARAEVWGGLSRGFEARFGRPLCAFGWLSGVEEGVVYRRGGEAVVRVGGGHDHFKSNEP